MSVFAVVGEAHALAELLETGTAIFANAIGVDQAPDRGQIAFLEFAPFASDFHNASYNFVTGNAWIDRSTPFVAHDMQIGMTYPAEKNLDLDISRG